MRVLNIVSTKSWGGIEQYVYDVCKEGKRRGRPMFVAINSKQTVMIKRYEDVATVIPIDFRNIKILQTLGILIKVIKEKNIKFVNIHTGKIVVLLGVLLKQKLKGNQFKLITFRHNLVANKKDIYHKFFQKRTDAFICVSKRVYNLQFETIEKKYRDKVKLIYNGIDLERFPKVNVKKNVDEFVIGYAGRLVENKGLVILLDGFASLNKKYPQLKLKMIGHVENEFKEKLKMIIKEKNIENCVKISEYTSDINRFYRSLDLFILPSIVKESFGLVLCEAMVCGVPVITTNSGAQEEIVQNGVNGLVVETKDLKGLENAIEKIYNDKKLRQKLVDGGKECVEKRFTIQSCVDELEAVYQALK